MRILITHDPYIPVPPNGYGGHERLVYLFAREYQRLGHEVHLLVGPGSEVENCTVYTFGKAEFPPNKWNARKAIFEAWGFLSKHHKNFDLVHNFGRLAYLLPILNKPIKKIMTYGRQITARNIQVITKLPNQNLVFTAPSDDCLSTGNVAGHWQTVYNAIDFSKYNVQPTVPKEAPLIFLSRLDQCKGCHIAIQVAKASGNGLIIAGNISTLPHEIEYFKREIEPHIDQNQIKYVGTVNDQQKNEYLGKAKAMLFPIDVREAFGMVMAESMACGTPVIAFPKGSVPEVIEEGVTGFVVNDTAYMIKALEKIPQIDRSQCRKAAEERFDVKVVTQRYLNLFSGQN